MDPDPEQMSLLVLCQCGCGTPLPPTNKLGQPSRFAHGHNRRKPDTPTAKRRVRKASPPRIPDQPLSVPCACGCGTMLPAINQLGRPSQWAKGHHNRGRRLSEEQRRGLSERQKRLYDLKGRKEPTWRRHSDPRYREWRLAVFERDAYTCQACGYVGQANEKGFAAHHVKEWAKFPALRYDVPNGLTLCRPCHMSLHGLAVKPRTMRLCGCGCGTLIRSHSRDGKERHYVNGHFWRGRKRSDEQRQAMSAARKGQALPLSVRAAALAARRSHAMSSEEKRERQAAYDRRRRPPKGGARRGEQHPKARLSPDAVREIRRRFALGESHSALARALGVTPMTVWQVVYGITWKHVT